MVNIIWQTWWHIEEVYYPTQARKIRQVMDIFTDETEIPLELNDEFVGLKIFGRNGSSYREIAFLETNGVNGMAPIILNLSPLESFPPVPNNLYEIPDLKHVKLEIEYILINPKIFNNWNESLIHKIKGILFPKKRSTIQINNFIQPEFYFTTPPGWRIANKGHSIGMGCYIKTYLFSWDEISGNDDERIIEILKDKLKIEWAKTENISKIDDGKTIIVSNKEKSLSLKLNDEETKVNLKIDDGRVDEFTVKAENGKLKIYIRNNPHAKSDKGIALNNPKPIKINFEEPFIKRTNEKETYNYLIHEKSYKTIKELKNKSSSVCFEFTYLSRMSYTLAVISLIPFIIFLPASSTILICGLLSLIQKSPFIFDTSFGLGYLIVLLSYSYFYYNLLKDDFYIPNKNLFGLIFALTLFVISSILLKDIFNIPAFIDSISKGIMVLLNIVWKN